MNSARIIPLLFLLGCTNSVGSGRTLATDDPKTGPVIIETIQLSGATLEAAAVRVGDLPDEDGVADKRFSARFDLEDCQNVSCLGVDRGKEETYRITIASTRTSDDQQFFKTVTVALH